MVNHINMHDDCRLCHSNRIQLIIFVVDVCFNLRGLCGCRGTTRRSTLSRRGSVNRRSHSPSLGRLRVSANETATVNGCPTVEQRKFEPVKMYVDVEALLVAV